tara:strand:+ start:427 stop:1608 length:1182 start_codon:yes stop_codon:yes gene_type:complete
MSYRLTRYLYARDEVEASLLSALLTRADIHECYFWAYELHYSGFELFAVLWRIFYDVYFEYNPCLEIYIRKKHLLWEREKKSEVFAFVIKNMFLATPSSNVFVLRQYALSVGADGHGADGHGADGYRGRPPKWCEQHDKKYQTWLRAISKKDYQKIAYHTYTLASDDDENVEETKESDAMFGELVTYFASMFNINADVSSYWNSRTYRGNDAHYILSIIIHLLVDEDESAIKMSDKKPLRPRDEHIQWVKDLECNNTHGCLPRNVLKQHRLYGINPNIGSFALARYTLAETEFQSVNCFWERYAFNTPIWLHRFEKFKAATNAGQSESGTISFESDDDLEAFYDLYGLEPDEQTREVQNLSTGIIALSPWIAWFNTVFSETSAINFDERFQFI